MTARLRARWVMLTLRERALILVMIALFALVILWLGIVRPIDDRLARAQADHAIAVDRAGRIATLAALLKGAGAAPPAFSGALDQVVQQSATEAGFTLDSANMVGPDRLAVAIGSARAPALFAWLAALEGRGIGVETITVQPGSNTTVSARILLKVAR